MTKEKGLALGLFLMLLVPIFMTETVEASPAPLFFINPYRVTHKGDGTKTVCITLEISNLAGGTENLYGWGCTLSWPSANLTYLSASEGPMLPSGGYSTFWVTPIVDQDAGTVLLGDARTGDVPGEVGSGILAYINFQVDVEAVGDLGLSEVKLRNTVGNPLNPNDGPPDFYFTNNRESKYGPPIPEDITAVKGIFPDCPMGYEAIVDIFDLASVAIKWGWSGTPGEIPEDIVVDGQVDIDDLISVSVEWGYYF